MRDVLPQEAVVLASLASRVLGSFELHGYERVVVPAFEYEAIFARGLGELGPGELLRFVEPESGEVVALRPDMTPQVARLLAARLADAPSPARLCYQGTVLRRRHERARRQRQMPQAGIELVGLGGLPGDLEVLRVATQAVKAAGLTSFVVDLAHAGVAGSLLARVLPEKRPAVFEALQLKDSHALAQLVSHAGLAGPEQRALAGLLELHGDEQVFVRAEPLLTGTVAEPGFLQLRELHARLSREGLAPKVVVDLGEPSHQSYYTGVTFQILAEGPGEAIGSGGRYDRLFERFLEPRPAAGFAVDLDNLAWALAASGVTQTMPLRVLVVGHAPELAEAQARALRLAGLAAVVTDQTEPLSYAQSWRFSHLLETTPAGTRLIDVTTGADRQLGLGTPSDHSAAVAAILRPAPAAFRGQSVPQE